MTTLTRWHVVGASTSAVGVNCGCGVFFATRGTEDVAEGLVIAKMKIRVTLSERPVLFGLLIFW